MKITAIYGTNHIGSTVLLARELIHALPHQPEMCIRDRVMRVHLFPFRTQ